MTTVIDFKIELNNLDEFSEVLQKVKWNYLEGVGITQVGSYGDIRVAMELLKYVNMQFKEVLLLRSEDPDLMQEFNHSFNILAAKRDEMNKNLEILLK